MRKVDFWLTVPLISKETGQDYQNALPRIVQSNSLHDPIVRSRRAQGNSRCCPLRLSLNQNEILSATEAASWSGRGKELLCSSLTPFATPYPSIFSCCASWRYDPPKSMKSGWKTRMVDMQCDSTTNRFRTSWMIERDLASFSWIKMLSTPNLWLGVFTFSRGCRKNMLALDCIAVSVLVQITTNVNIYLIVVAWDYATMRISSASGQLALTPELQEALRHFAIFACFTPMFLSVHGDKIRPEVLENIRKKIARRRFSLSELFYSVFASGFCDFRHITIMTRWNKLSATHKAPLEKDITRAVKLLVDHNLMF